MVMVPIVMANIIDIGIKNSDKPYIYRMCGVLVMLGVLGLAASLTAQYFAAKAAVGFGTGEKRPFPPHKHLLARRDR